MNARSKVSMDKRIHRYLKISPKLVRINEWWDFKLPLPLCAIFAAAATDALAPASLIIPVVLLLSSGFTAGVFASVINDFTDFKQDQEAKKDKVISHVSHQNRIGLLLLSITMVALNAFCLSGKTLSLTWYLATVGCFAIYSIKPLRFKERGWLAPLTIAFGEHLFPVLLAFALVSDFCAWQRSWPLLLSLSTIGFCLGLRGILWHLLSDKESDLSAGTDTIATSGNSSALLFIGHKLIFPLEVAALVYLLSSFNSVLACLFLGAHAVIEFLHYRYFTTNFIIIAPAPNHRFVLFEYYQILLPLAFILTASVHQMAYFGWAPVYCLLFIRPVYHAIKNLFHLLRFRTYPWCKYILGRRGNPKARTVEEFEPLVFLRY